MITGLQNILDTELEKMIEYIKGDLFDAETDALAHGCNTIGKMNAGIAKEFKKRFPEMYEDYKARCRKGLFLPGKGYIFKNYKKPHIINLGTQCDEGASIYYVEKSLGWLYDSYKEIGLKDVAIPKIASGLGGLEWPDVEKVLKDYFYNSDLLIQVREKD
ncbi:phosphatase [Candidatus Woesearchaeota archaeon]|nr:phosphatase [Candidatus Woesearchaeota archaeon]